MGWIAKSTRRCPKPISAWAGSTAESRRAASSLRTCSRITPTLPAPEVSHPGMGLSELAGVDVLVPESRDRERAAAVDALLAVVGAEPGGDLGDHAVTDPQVHRAGRDLAGRGVEGPHLSDQHRSRLAPAAIGMTAVMGWT